MSNSNVEDQVAATNSNANGVNGQALVNGDITKSSKQSDLDSTTPSQAPLGFIGVIMLPFTLTLAVISGWFRMINSWLKISQLSLDVVILSLEITTIVLEPIKRKQKDIARILINFVDMFSPAQIQNLPENFTKFVQNLVEIFCLSWEKMITDVMSKWKDDSHSSHPVNEEEDKAKSSKQPEKRALSPNEKSASTSGKVM